MTTHIKKNGILGAAIFFALTFILYFAAKDWLISMTLLGVIIILLIVLAVRSAKGDRTDNGGHIAFGGAFKSAFLTMLIASLGGTISGIILHNVIDPGLAEYLELASIEKWEVIMLDMGAPVESIDESLAGMEGISEQFSVMGHITSYFQMAIFYALIALVIGLIVRKEQDYSTSLD